MDIINSFKCYYFPFFFNIDCRNFIDKEGLDYKYLLTIHH